MLWAYRELKKKEPDTSVPSGLQLHAIVQQADKDSVFVPLQGICQAVQLAEQGIQLQQESGE